MKLFIAFALFAVASAGVLPPAIVANEDPELQQIIAAIQSPSTDPATAAALEQMLLEILGLVKPEPIEVGPAIVEGNEPISIGPAIVENDVPISIGPAIIDFPLPDGGAVSEVQPAPVQPAPVSPAASASLVQIILNINAASNVAGAPVVVETNPSPIPQPVPSPVHVVEEAVHPDPVIVVENPIIPEVPISIGPAIIGGNEPVSIGPAIVDNDVPISIGPAIIGGNEPISIGPAIVENDVPISIGPAIIDFPLPDSSDVSEMQPAPVQPAPVVPSASASLVQIILNVNAESNVAGSPVAIETNPSPIPQPVPSPVHVVEEAVHPDPVIVVENPIVPEPVITLPDILN